MKAKVAIVSLRCNPAFIQHLIAYAKAVTELGHEVVLLLDPAYQHFTELREVAPILEPGANLCADSWTHAVFLNVALENRELADALRHQNTKILYVYHEPWQMSVSYLFGEGIKSTLKAILAHRTTIPMLRIANMVILESQFGLEAYQGSDARFNGACTSFPQIYDDEAPNDLPSLLAPKRYFAFIGALCHSHGFDQFVTFMQNSLEQGKNVTFLIASRNPFPAHILRSARLRPNLGNIEIRCGQPLTNDEMNRCYAESFCVWNIYRRSTQSGVLPKAFMFGTPVIASKLGSFPEYIEEGVNGRFATAEDHQGIQKALEEIRRNIGTYAANCRRTFVDTFFYRSRLTDLERLL